MILLSKLSMDNRAASNMTRHGRLLGACRENRQPRAGTFLLGVPADIVRTIHLYATESNCHQEF